MAFFELIILAVVQGITEFLPVSSSGHLRAAAELLSVQQNTLVIDVAVHVGTLGAVVIYFGRDVARVVAGGVQMLRGRRSEGGMLAVYLVLATIPIGVAGFFGRGLVEADLRSLEIVGWTTIGFGIALWLADRSGMTVLRLDHLSVSNALIIGVAQVLALVPGASRAGITITAARMLGYERSEAARFSMLLSIPAIAGAGLVIGLELIERGDAALSRDAVVSAILAFVTALAAIALFMRWLRFASFGIFVVYRVLLGAAILYWIYAS